MPSKTVHDVQTRQGNQSTQSEREMFDAMALDGWEFVSARTAPGGVTHYYFRTLIMEDS